MPEAPGPSEIPDWFFNRRCGHWREGCLVTEAQQSELQEETRQFLPEPFCGSPTNDMWVLTLNPGLSTTGQDIEDQMCYCPYLENGEVRLHGQPLDQLGYEEHFRTWYAMCSYSWGRKDYVTRGALSILLARDGVLGERLPTFSEADLDQHRVHLAQITVLNVVHCKSRTWRSSYAGCGCTEQTAKIIKSQRPRIVVAMGVGVWRWMTKLGWRSKDQPSWTDAGSFKSFPGVTFVAAYHPGRRNWEKPRRFSAKHAQAVADTIRRFFPHQVVPGT